MSTEAQPNLKARKILFASLLAVICIALVYSAFQRDKPWIVPEEIKRLRNPLTPSESTLKAAREIYMDECAQCHGEHGKGDGPEAATHYPPPSNITDAQHMNTVTDGEIFYQISEGRKPMPSFKKRLTEDQRWELVLLVRSFVAPSASPIQERMPEASKKPGASSKD
jgi:mono/diheme cytochrome c family protein